ncbi:MAG: hypothetical protein EAZ74_01660 [Alphaproteobacteria bacterium]|nr:MAG: hypothetical protein EAY76_07080 [Alphaproteobacteria bacterium]TAF15500.1 MAG: hypothetical protein EAZ74_01660 [Alphaproteobacteria bacterium]TAF40951.1 MAG: hypothetical protein EAZ66_02100 [Alphaproteobacteria bacterium]
MIEFMALLTQSSSLWLLAAAVMMALEAMGLNGVGVLFGGIAAFVVGVLIELGVIDADATLAQWAVWFALTTIIGWTLYKPLKRFRSNTQGKDQFSNIVGTQARVASGGLMVGKQGKVHWSGTMMGAQIDPSSSQEAFLEGDMVEIIALKGNQLLVAPLGSYAAKIRSDEE